MIWTVLLVGAFAGWAVLDGMNQGLGATLRQVGRTPGERRTVLTALGPFLLAGEVWLIAAAGVLLAGFPDLERDLWFVAYPLVIALLVTWVLRDAGVWLRSRRPGVRWRAGWERVVVVASVGPAAVGRCPARDRARVAPAAAVADRAGGRAGPDRPVRRRRHPRPRHHVRRHPDLGRPARAGRPPGRCARCPGRRGCSRRRAIAYVVLVPADGPLTAVLPPLVVLAGSGSALVARPALAAGRLHRALAAVVVGGVLPVVAAAIALAPDGLPRADPRARAARLRPGAARGPGVGLVDVPAPGRPPRRGLLLTEPSRSRDVVPGEQAMSDAAGGRCGTQGLVSAPTVLRSTRVLARRPDADRPAPTDRGASWPVPEAEPVVGSTIVRTLDAAAGWGIPAPRHRAVPVRAAGSSSTPSADRRAGRDGRGLARVRVRVPAHGMVR